MIIVVAVLIGLFWLLLIKMLAESIRANRKTIRTNNGLTGENIVKISICKSTIIQINEQLERYTDDELVSLLRKRLGINNELINLIENIDKLAKAENERLAKSNKRDASILKILTLGEIDLT